jgi:hypothetical protein
MIVPRRAAARTWIVATVVGTALTLCGCASTGGAPRTSRTRTSVSREEAIRILETTDTFADTSVGFGGGPSKEACAFAVVVREPDADSLFRALLENGRTAGQLYALCGLYFTDPAGFTRAVSPYRGRKDSVKTFSGCLGGASEVGRVVEHAHPHAVRLASPKETLAQWVQRNPEARPAFFVDIVGGGYPAALRAMRPCRAKPGTE